MAGALSKEWKIYISGKKWDNQFLNIKFQIFRDLFDFILICEEIGYGILEEDVCSIEQEIYYSLNVIDVDSGNTPRSMPCRHFSYLSTRPMSRAQKRQHERGRMWRGKR